MMGVVNSQSINTLHLSNTFFKFKQFTIHQDQCAMKVSTDSCILGAWFARKVTEPATILDIGSGTGLLMMMIAQKTKSQIHGIELDLSCFKQLQENVARCSWKDRLLAIHGDARNHVFSSQYDLIISNPPFYEADLPSANSEENMARHSSKLSLKELIEVIDKNLSSQGAFCVLLPYSRCEYFVSLSEKHRFFLQEKLLIRHSPEHPFSRAILYFSRKENVISESEISIRRNDREYSDKFTDLLKDYYLYL